jgi:hypothetical protein
MNDERPSLPGAELDVPEGVRLVIGRRLDRLGERARKVLTAAAVIGAHLSDRCAPGGRRPLAR